LTERRKLVHDIRNGMNTLVLNTQCLPISTRSESIECLDAIDNAVDSIIELVDKVQALPDEPAAPAAANA
jgi:hypothetical protein